MQAKCKHCGSYNTELDDYTTEHSSVWICNECGKTFQSDIGPNEPEW
ncbi:MAG: hypothetical protein ACFFD4_08095 [Candidatus Odinarchaeota archaeon]